MPETVTLPDGFVRVRHVSDAAATCTGTPMGNGQFAVPTGLVAGLRAHGFLPLDEHKGPDVPPMAPAEAEARLAAAEAERDALAARLAEVEARLAAAAKPPDRLAKA